MGVTTNLALNKTVTASGFVSPYSASRAVNGSLTTFSRWLCNSVPSWLCVDLGANYWINRWVVRHMSVAGWRSPDYNMCDFKLQGSNDNKTWYDIDSVVGNISSVTDRTLVAAVNVRYVRAYVTKGLKCNTQYASLMEFEVYPAPSSQYLTGLSISNGTLSPTPFAGRTTFAYTASVGYDVSSITVTPTAEDSHATIKVNNVIVTNGSASGPISLSVGSNAINVQVTASDGSAQVTYTITVTRAGSQYLSGLSISNGTLSPTFGKTNFSYTASVGFDVTSITVTPTAEDSSATITVNSTPVPSGQASGPIDLNVGANTITLQVTAAGGTPQQTYTINMTRASSPYLTMLKLTSGRSQFNLNPTFSKTTLLYSAAVSTISVNVTPTAEDSAASITVNGTSTASGQAVLVQINTGVNPINVVVTSSVGNDSKTYVINATK